MKIPIFVFCSSCITCLLCMALIIAVIRTLVIPHVQNQLKSICHIMDIRHGDLCVEIDVLYMDVDGHFIQGYLLPSSGVSVDKNKVRAYLKASRM